MSAKNRSLKVKRDRSSRLAPLTCSALHYQETKFGFEYGAAKITRLCSDEKKGWIMLGIETPKYKNPMQIYVTKTGKVRVWGKGEWKPNDKGIAGQATDASRHSLHPVVGLPTNAEKTCVAW